MAALKSMQNKHSEIENLSSTSQKKKKNQGYQSVEHILKGISLQNIAWITSNCIALQQLRCYSDMNILAKREGHVNLQ